MLLINKMAEVKEKYICRQFLKGGKRCDKIAIYIANYTDLNLTGVIRKLVCNFHATILTKQSKKENSNIADLELKLLPGKHAPTPKNKLNKSNFMDSIDEKIKDSSKCCIHLEKDGPLCSLVVCYRIQGKYFCRIHGKQHPEAKDAITLNKVINTKDRKMIKIDDRLDKIEQKIDKLIAQLEYLMQQPEFREAVYAIETRKQSSLLNPDTI